MGVLTVVIAGRIDYWDSWAYWLLW